MPSLRQLQASHAPLLLIDAASSVVQVAALERDGTAQWESSTAEAGIGIFEAIQRLRVQPDAARAFLFCDGPGSILGIRTAAMAIRTWCVLQPRPVFGYCSLAVVAHARGQADLAVIADARRDSWHHYQIGRGLTRVPTNQLGGALTTPDEFRSWTPLPNAVTRTPYALSALFAQVADADLFSPTAEPDAFLHEQPSYVTWTPQIHRPPPSSGPSAR